MVTPEERITRLEAIQEATTQQLALVLSRLDHVLQVVEAARQEAREMNEATRQEAREMNEATRQEAREDSRSLRQRHTNRLNRRGETPVTCSSPLCPSGRPWLPVWEGVSSP